MKSKMPRTLSLYISENAFQVYCLCECLCIILCSTQRCTENSIMQRKDFVQQSETTAALVACRSWFERYCIWRWIIFHFKNRYKNIYLYNIKKNIYQMCKYIIKKIKLYHRENYKMTFSAFFFLHNQRKAAWLSCLVGVKSLFSCITIYCHRANSDIVVPQWVSTCWKVSTVTVIVMIVEL